MSWQFIHDDDIAATEGWYEALLNIREESGAVHRAIEHEWGNNPVVAQTCDKGDRFPMSVWNRCDQSLAGKQRPLSRTIFVLVAVSSINTSRAGSSMPCSRIQRRRARATSARFCSAACRLFFKADIMSIEETLESASTAGDALLRHGGEDLLKGQIGLFGNQSQKPIRVLFQRRGAPSALFGLRAPGIAPTSTPSDHRTNTQLEHLGSLPPRRSAFNRFNRTLTQVRGIRLRHRCSSLGESIFSDSPKRKHLGIPLIQRHREML